MADTTYPQEELLSAIPCLMAVLEEGSARRAATRTGTTTATVLRRIERAEEALGTLLFERLPTGLAPTDALVAMVPSFERVMSHARGAMHQLAELDETTSGIVRLSLTSGIAAYLLPDFLLRLDGEVQLEFAVDTALVDLHHGQADLAIRHREPSQPELLRKRLASFPYTLAASPERADEWRDTSPNALPWVTWERGLLQTDVEQWRLQHAADAPIALRVSDLATKLRAVAVGLGVAFVPEPLREFHRLVALPLEIPVPHATLWLVAHPAVRRIPRVATVWDRLVEHFEEGAAGNVDTAAQR